MATAIPEPPFTGPIDTVPQGPDLAAGKARVWVFTYHADTGKWLGPAIGDVAWMDVPFGYYRTPDDFAAQMILVVIDRLAPTGATLPNVLAYPNWVVISDKTTSQDADGSTPNAQPPPPPNPSDQCPPGFIFLPFSFWYPNGEPPASWEEQLDPSQTGLCVPIGPAFVIVPTINPNPPPPYPCPPGTHWDSNNETCVADKPPPPPPFTCPPGFHWDPLAEFGKGGCVPDPLPPPPTGTQPPCPPFTAIPDCLPKPPQLGRTDDPLDDLIALLGYWLQIATIYLMNLFQTLQQGGGFGGGGGGTAACCDQIVKAISSVAAAINAIAAALPSSGGGGGGAPDLTPIVTAIGTVATAIAAIPGPPSLTTIESRLGDIATAIADLAPTDAATIAQRIKELNDSDIAGKDLLDQLIALDLIDPGVGQILGDPARVRIDPTRYHPETIKTLKWLSGVTPEEANRLLVYLKNLLGRLFDWANNELGNLITGTNTPATTILQKLTPQFNALAAHTSDWIDLVPMSVMQMTETVIENGGPVTPDNAEARGFRAFGFAFLVGQGIHILADLAKFLGYPMSSLWSNNAALLVELLAFDDIRKNLHGPYWEAQIGVNRRYQVNREFRPYVPPIGTALNLYARRVIDRPTVDQLLGYAGARADFVDYQVAGSYRGVQVRALAALYQDVEFDTDAVREMLEFSGVRPDMVLTLLQGFERASVKNVRNQYVSALLAAAERGNLTQPEIDAALDDLAFSDQAKHWVNLTIATRKLEQLSELYRKSISEAYKFGQITDDQYVPALEAIEIAAADAQAHFAVDSIAKRGHDAAAAARAAARLANQVTRAQSAAAIANYQRGNLDDAGLAAALEAAGVPLVVIPFAVDLQSLKRDARKHFVFGIRVGPDQAIALKERVAALKEQFVKAGLAIDSARAQLTGLGIPAATIQALLAAWTAQVNKQIIPIQ